MITSTSNQQMKRIVQLQKKSKARYEQRVFVVEGAKMVLEAPIEWIERVYVSESFIREEENKKKVAVYDYEIVSDAVFKSISDTQTPQGILCLVKMPEYTWEDIMQGENTHVLILESIQDPGNLGTMLRTGEGAGLTGVITNRTTVDVFHPKTLRSTMGSIYRVPILVVDSLSDILKQLKEENVHLYAAHLKGSLSYDCMNYKKATGFLIGNEGNGLTEEIAQMADNYIRIPMEGKVESLNAAIAASLLMYEVNRQRRQLSEC